MELSPSDCKTTENLLYDLVIQFSRNSCRECVDKLTTNYLHI